MDTIFGAKDQHAHHIRARAGGATGAGMVLPPLAQPPLTPMLPYREEADMAAELTGNGCRRLRIGPGAGFTKR